MSPEELKNMIFAEYFRQIITKYDLPHFPKEKFKSNFDNFYEVALDIVFTRYVIGYSSFIKIVPAEIVFLNEDDIAEYLQWTMYKEFHVSEHKRRQWTAEFFEDKINPLLSKAIKNLVYNEEIFRNDFHSVITVDEKGVSYG